MFGPDDDIRSVQSSWFNDDSKWDIEKFGYDIGSDHPGHHDHHDHHDHSDEVFTYSTGDGPDIRTIMQTLSVTGMVVVAGIIVAVLACCLCRRRRSRGVVLAPPTTTTTTVTTAGPRGVTTVVAVPATSMPYPTQQYYAPSTAPVIQPYPVTYAPQSYPMPAPYPTHAPAEPPSVAAHNAPPPTYEQATDGTTKQPPYNPYAPS